MRKKQLRNWLKEWKAKIQAAWDEMDYPNEASVSKTARVYEILIDQAIETLKCASFPLPPIVWERLRRAKMDLQWDWVTGAHVELERVVEELSKI